MSEHQARRLAELPTEKQKQELLLLVQILNETKKHSYRTRRKGWYCKSKISQSKMGKEQETLTH